MTARLSASLPEPERWTSRPAGGTAAEDRLAGALRTAAEVTLQAARAPAATWVPSPRLARRRRRRSLVLAALLAGAGGVVWATVGGQETPPAPPPAASPVVASAPVSRPDPPAPVATPITRQTVPRAAPLRTAKATPRPKPAAAPSPTEVGLLAEAYRHLRVDRDAAAALSRVEEYARRFPTGALRLEAEVARVEALLMLGRRPEALEALAALPPAIAGPVRQRLQLSPRSR